MLRDVEKMARMEYARRLLGLSQDEVAMEVRMGGVKRHSGSFERWFRGDQVPDADIYEVIAQMLDSKLQAKGLDYRVFGHSYWVDPETGRSPVKAEPTPP